MSDLREKLESLNLSGSIDKLELVDQLEKLAQAEGYAIADRNDTKPWGAYLRFDGKDADTFIQLFFPGLSPVEARLGVDDAELSPKFLLVSPGQRLSWQYHDRRAERWAFLNDGAYCKSNTDEQGDVISAHAGDIVQFAKGERHRLVGVPEKYTLVAEIWQHTDTDSPSDEDDIVRLEDDFGR